MEFVSLGIAVVVVSVEGGVVPIAAVVVAVVSVVVGSGVVSICSSSHDISLE